MNEHTCEKGKLCDKLVAAEVALEKMRQLFIKRNDWNRNIRDSLVKLFTEAGWQPDCTLINYLTMMNFDDAQQRPERGEEIK